MGRRKRNRSKKQISACEGEIAERSLFNTIWQKINDSVSNNGFIRGAKAFEAFKGYK